MRDKLQARAQLRRRGIEPGGLAARHQDSIRALMLIRAYHVMGHLAAASTRSASASAKSTRS